MAASNDTTSARNYSGSLADYVEITDDYGAQSLVSQINGVDGDIFQLIRLEKEPDVKTLQHVLSKDSIIQKINEVRLEQCDYGRSDVYEREWESRQDDRITIEASLKPIISLTILQFNVLAEGLSSCPSKSPFKGSDCSDQRDRVGGHGGFSNIPYPSVTLDFERRKWRLVEVIFGRNLDAPYDIIAMQEVDRYRGFFRPIFNVMGYDSIFVPKKNSPGVRLGWYSDGCVLAWKCYMFELIHERTGDYTVGNQVFITATLVHKVSKQMIIVAVTHLKAQQSDVNEAVRCRQVDELLIAINDEWKICSNKNVQIIVLGDFNADPPSKTDFDCSAVQKLLAQNHNHNSTYHRQYCSAYTIDDPSANMFTSWKIRGMKVSKRIIDYIFYTGGSSSIRCVATLKVPNEIEETKLPGLRHPSDHLHIAAKFEIG